MHRINWEGMWIFMAKALPASGEILFQGVTINEFNAGYAFDRAKALGIGGVILRATAGEDYRDARADSYAQQVKANGLRLGFYHYLTATDAQSARAQARAFVRAISGTNYDLRPAMRYDLPDGISFTAANSIASAFLSTVQEETEIAPAVYTDAGTAVLVWDRSIAEKYPLWVIDEESADAPAAGTSQWKSWVGWQYQRSIDPACGCAGTPVSRFTSGMLARQIVVPPVQPPAQGSKLICVRVAAGDTLTSIARTFGVTVNSIVRLNAISNPNRIYPGQRLYIRVDASVPYDCCDTYTVRRGDTLSGIADRFSTSWRRLASINEISNPNRISVGQVIRLGLCDG